jgi:hypothetical protein
MGLDSAELLQEFEDYFKIQLSNEDTAQISTVQDETECIARYLAIPSRDTTLQEKMRSRLSSCLKERYGISRPIQFSDLLAE